ncbi:MAG: hypothetical protein RR202_05360 [Bacteroidales bacterium]
MKNKRTDFEQIIRHQKESGKSAVAFCREERISYSTFRYWVKKSRDNADYIKMELIPVTIEHGFDMERIGEIIYPNGVKFGLTGNLSRSDLAALINIQG